MTWKIEFDAGVEKDLKKLGPTAQKKVLKYIKEKIMTTDNPRLLAKIEDKQFVILVVHVGHRKDVYR